MLFFAFLAFTFVAAFVFSSLQQELHVAAIAGVGPILVCNKLRHLSKVNKVTNSLNIYLQFLCFFLFYFCCFCFWPTICATLPVPSSQFIVELPAVVAGRVFVAYVTLPTSRSPGRRLRLERPGAREGSGRPTCM